MAERRKERAPRGSAASRLDEVTLVLLVALLSLMVGVVLKLGPVEALDRIERGLNAAVNGLTARWQP